MVEVAAAQVLMVLQQCKALLVALEAGLLMALPAAQATPQALLRHKETTEVTVAQAARNMVEVAAAGLVHPLLVVMEAGQKVVMVAQERPQLFLGLP